MLLARLALIGAMAWWVAHWLGGLLRGRSRPEASPESDPRSPEKLVKDPICGLCFPEGDGIRLDRAQLTAAGDSTLFFCSTECRDQFQAQAPTVNH